MDTFIRFVTGSECDKFIIELNSGEAEDVLMMIKRQEYQMALGYLLAKAKKK